MGLLIAALLVTAKDRQNNLIASIRNWFHKHWKRYTVELYAAIKRRRKVLYVSIQNKVQNILSGRKKHDVDHV